MRFPSTALLEHETREKTALVLECRESLELPRQPEDDAAVAARLVLDEKNNITPNGSANNIPNKGFLQKEEMGDRMVDNPQKIAHTKIPEIIKNETKNYRAEGVMENTVAPNRKTTKATGRMRTALREPTSSRMSITNSFNNVRENKRLDKPGDKSHVENKSLSPLPSPRDSKY